jgi:hypothetical protein
MLAVWTSVHFVFTHSFDLPTQSKEVFSNHFPLPGTGSIRSL